MIAGRALVIGAGIIGAAIAYYLTKAGWRTCVIEAGEAGGLATRHSWAWINASWGNPEPYFRLRVRAMEEWRRLERELPGLPVSWSGGLIWDLPPDKLEEFANQHGSWGYALRPVNRSGALAIEPSLVHPPEFALHASCEGAAEPMAAALALLAGAARHGASILAGEKVSAIELSGDRAIAVWTERRRVDADVIVIAAGLDAPRLLESVGFSLRLDAPPGLLVHSKPLPKIMNGLVMAPDIHVRQSPDGRLVAGSDYGGADPGADAAHAAAALFGILQGTIRAPAPIVFDRHTIGLRPIPVDGFPAIGPVPGAGGLYAAVTHSGVTLAPAIGLFLAQEVIENRRDPLLAPYGLERFCKQ